MKPLKQLIFLPEKLLLWAEGMEGSRQRPHDQLNPSSLFTYYAIAFM